MDEKERIFLSLFFIFLKMYVYCLNLSLLTIYGEVRITTKMNHPLHLLQTLNAWIY